MKDLEFRVIVPIVIDMKLNPATRTYEPVPDYQQRIAEDQAKAERLVEGNRDLLTAFINTNPQNLHMVEGSFLFTSDGRVIYKP